MARAEAPRILQATLDDQPPDKQTRNSYTRETKLKVIEFYYSRRKNLYQTCKHFELNTKTVMRWIKDEQKIRDSKKGSKHADHDRRAKYPEIHIEGIDDYVIEDEEDKESTDEDPFADIEWDWEWRYAKWHGQATV